MSADSELAGVTSGRRILYGPLPSADVITAVVRRLRAAIGLGLLTDNERLPREADLAKQLGVTSFSLREALGELRAQGLIVTRAGKNGGSFVRQPKDGSELALDELVRFSSIELRDLGDWRQMLVGHSATLAAQRASDTHITRLFEYAKRVGESVDAEHARRAHGRFHVELASAAQSMRMSRAEFAVHEEIDWLFGLALDTPVQRDVSATGLQEIVEAVQSRDADKARMVAQQYSSRLVLELGRLRLQALASSRLRESGLTANRLPNSSLPDEIESILKAILGPLRQLAGDAAAILDGSRSSEELRAAATLAILQRIGSLPGWMDGFGILAEVGVLPDHPYWISWWNITDTGPVESHEHVTDPEREDFYEYANLDWMTYPRERHEVWASGPYVDYGGVDDYTLTVAAPILVGDRFLGTAVVDLLVADLEKRLAPWLASTEETFLLLNVEDRIVVSNSLEHQVGDVSTAYSFTVVRSFPIFGWTLVRLEPVETRDELRH